MIWPRLRLASKLLASGDFMERFAKLGCREYAK